MKKIAFFGFFLLSAWIVSCPVSAETITLKLTSPGNIVHHGYYVGPYTAAVNGTDETMQIVCDDFAHHVWVGRQWTANVHSFSDLDGTRWGAGAVLKYKQVAWLVGQMELNPTEIGDIHLALWNIFTSSTPDTVGSAKWLGKVPTDFSGYGNYFNRFIIITPTDTGRNSAQEFIGTKPVPEPMALLLLGTGLSGTAALLRRRSKNKAGEDAAQ